MMHSEKEHKLLNHWQEKAERAQQEWVVAQERADTAMKLQESRERDWAKEMNSAVLNLEEARTQLETSRVNLDDAEQALQRVYRSKPRDYPAKDHSKAAKEPSMHKIQTNPQISKNTSLLHMPQMMNMPPNPPMPPMPNMVHMTPGPYSPSKVMMPWTNTPNQWAPNEIQTGIIPSCREMNCYY